MKRDWKPGDVAMLTYKSADAGDGEHVAMYASATCRICFSGQASQRGHWHTLGGILNDADSYNPRPLVVIDPEDRGQVEALISAWFEEQRNTGKVAHERMGAALYGLLAPPKPSEPLGLGAVVEDGRGYKFVRVADHIDGWAAGAQWQRIGGELNAIRNFGWDQVAAVRVLSEGVTS